MACRLTDNRRVELKICTPHKPVRMVSARLSGEIKSLQCLWPADSPKKFIFNGSELLENQTFESYGISDGDSIIAVPADQKDTLFSTSQWLNLTRDNESFNDCMRWMLDPATSGEAARLRDLHLMKMERRPRVFMRMCASYMQEEEENRGLKWTKKDYPIATEPMTDPLPFDWFESQIEQEVPTKNM